MSEHLFFDGHSAAQRIVTLRAQEGGLAIHGEDGSILAMWSIAAMRVVGENAVNQALTLRLDPDQGARLHVAEGADKIAIQERFPALARWRRHERLALLKGFALWGGLGIVVCLAFYLAWGRAAIWLADWMPEPWENRLGDVVQSALVRASRVCAEETGQQALVALADRLRPARLQGKSLTVIVVKGDIPNAFAIPGRRIVLFSGLIDRAESADMLAGVLAHEMAHAELRHPIRGVVHQLGVGAVISLLFGDSALASAGQVALALTYTRDIEREADARAIELLNEAGLRADGLSRFLDQIAKDPSLKSLLPDFLDTHPDLAERVVATRQPADGEAAMTEEEWARVGVMCGKK